VGQLGDTLRERRVSLGISLDTAEADTKIRGRLIQALEEGDYLKLPNPGYVRGYVSSYARYLELDPIPLLAMYRAETGAGRFHEINIPEHTVTDRHEQHAVPWRVAVIAAVIVALVAIAGWVAYRALREPTTPPPIPSTSATDASAGAQQTQTQNAPFTVSIRVAPNSASTLKATVDGSNAYNGTLAAGQTKTFQVTKSVVLIIGRPSRVTVARDGKKVTLPGTTPATVTLKADQP
jgi:cytoskeleton protein RodZ